ncbi:hypothetical protein TUM20985_43870 [Mycobacterium antarcticum]|uniref:class I SAM-dependent methyltransferase n=2 Tax=unclassified Mycolicibacterium TaxID=2636767 RepID=UPI00238B6AE5|nr:class I SAM-dependent methyltransferase [Mycolicibacterium sp. TUM20983]BDX33840.1 hypothetical protein TUM20985_43870 [Mycolicibacterium sp. TUM20985]GLP77014.1 hypothetical protein TUM20983_41240 [Mycolicibacterium sp. TUM20983]
MGYARYRYLGQRRVGGYTEGPVFDMVKVLDAAQRSDGIGGSVVEIGVHHGRLLIGMHLLQRPSENSVAIDLFDDQELNVDQSGLGDFDKFQQNLQKWSKRPVVVHQGDSTQLHPGDVAEMTGTRLFSVDGGHTSGIVRSDMTLAAGCLCPGGIVIADDVFNQQWPDVCVGTLDYLRGGGTLVPFGIGYNKTLFTQPEFAARYRAALVKGFAKSRLTATFPERSFDGHEVVILVAIPKTPAHLARTSPLARKLYHKVLR